jgi:Acetyltransferase (GNAT) domain
VASTKVFRTEKFCNSLADVWEDLVARSANGHFLHTRKFLGYHRDRFIDYSALVFEGDDCVAVMPAAIDPADETRIISHPGATFGGIVKIPALTEPHLSRVFTALIQFYSSSFRVLEYKAIPHIYQAIPAEDDLYVLNQLGARPSRCDLSATINLLNSSVYDLRRRKTSIRNRTDCLRLSWDINLIAQYWNILEKRLEQRYATKPVHSLSEIQELIHLFPSHIDLLTVSDETQMIAGLMIFKDRHVSHVQYMAATDVGLEYDALSFGIDTAIERARDEHYHFFDFGISTENLGTRVNEGLHRFKTSFGAGTTVHQFYELSLSSSEQRIRSEIKN